MTRRHFLLAAAALAAGGVRAQEPFLSRPVTLWLPWPAGGGTDLSMRVLAEAASRHLGARINVDNRSGAGGTLVMPLLQQAAPDGHTIAQLPQTVFRAVHTQKVLWDPIRDTTPIIQLSGTTFGMVVAADSPWRSVDEVFAAAKARPGQISIASNGVGTTPHVVIEELMQQRALSYIHVPYKGASEQALGVASGQVMVAVGSTAFGPFVDQGKLRLLATFGEQRSKRWPNVPTLKELGYGIAASSPYGLAGPRGLPQAIVAVLHDAFRAAMLEPAYAAELAKSDQELAYLGPADYARACRDALEQERGVVERLGLAKPAS
jgi:tripartite-type tricarboxylate transporter receptor subunit TctC